MGRPCGCGDQVSVDAGFVYGEFDVGATGGSDVGSDCRVATAAASLEHPGGGEDLGSVADGCDGFALFEEVPNDVEHFCVEAEIFGRASAGNVWSPSKSWMAVRTDSPVFLPGQTA
jgi:hypothetical protein